MKSKELENLKLKSTAELDTDLKNKKSELFNLRFQLAVGQLQNTAQIKTCKKDIAKVKTILREREINGTLETAGVKKAKAKKATKVEG